MSPFDSWDVLHESEHTKYFSVKAKSAPNCCFIDKMQNSDKERLEKLEETLLGTDKSELKSFSLNKWTHWGDSDSDISAVASKFQTEWAKSDQKYLQKLIFPEFLY